MNPINVTKTLLPSLSDYTALLEEIWTNNQLSNNGELVKRLENKLCNYLAVSNVELVTNGTIALQLAIKAGDLKGEIITTPFSYVATTTAILWEHCSPVFVDIETNSFTIDASKIEEAITPKTSAILATHVYGYPCDVEEIELIAKKHGLMVIYDAAHAFGVKYKGRSLLNYGDISTLSFHATKLFHTGEGGAVISNNDALTKKVNLLKRFGHNGEDEYLCEGINGKMSELHAAMGLSVLDKVDESILHRKKCSEIYDSLLVSNSSIIRPQVKSELEYNYAYYPIVLSSEELMIKVRSALNIQSIYPRRYFYPSLNNLPYIELNNKCPISESASSRVLALPLSHDLSEKEVRLISKIILEALK
ncbi:DegT/DnrJ/EryC1/StrS family aminotransferase [Vibrio aestuarianus]|uniref:DegT/DnrJ/EryC1/StrS family aminotransferase n=1 Tax=Vibrio aestuarianus TaxID=28171 RepID=A0AAX3U2B9_9VIBR|nr:DegT/DnrJ/EryC1/StrS family aminotransferase [Vibrio aestuarianus]WGK81285.1 DegT/DnrJ/EryC1/StrS family aminotransferase [Vibrio aestuarianus]